MMVFGLTIPPTICLLGPFSTNSLLRSLKDRNVSPRLNADSQVPARDTDLDQHRHEASPISCLGPEQ